MFTILKNKIYLFSLIISISTPIHSCDEFIIQIRAHTRWTHKNWKPVSRSDRKFHSWISVCARRGERLKRKSSSFEKFLYFFCNSRQFRWFCSSQSSENGKEWRFWRLFRQWTNEKKEQKRVEKKSFNKHNENNGRI